MSPLIDVLLAASVISITLGEYTDVGFIFLVLLLNAVIGAYQEWKAEEKASALEQMIKLKVRVKRDKKTVVIDSGSLVPGDIILPGISPSKANNSESFKGFGARYRGIPGRFRQLKIYRTFN